VLELEILNLKRGTDIVRTPSQFKCVQPESGVLRGSLRG
jgi:hypothetical protein